MIKILKIIFILLISLYLAVTLNEQATKVALEISGIRIETSLLVIFIAFIIIITLLHISYRVLSWPFTINHRMKQRTNNIKINKLIDLAMAIDAHNANAALKNLLFFKKSDLSSPYKAWIKYKIAKLQHNQETANKALYEMQQHTGIKENTLSLQAQIEMSNQSWPAAANTLHQLYDLQPNSHFILKSLVDSYMRSERWTDLLNLNMKNQDIINICNYKIAEKLYSSNHHGDLERALNIVLKYKQFLPTMLLLLKIQIKLGYYDDAIKTIAKHWAEHNNILFLPTLELLQYYASEKYSKLIHKIVDDHHIGLGYILHLYGLLYSNGNITPVMLQSIDLKYKYHERLISLYMSNNKSLDIDIFLLSHKTEIISYYWDKETMYYNNINGLKICSITAS